MALPASEVVFFSAATFLAGVFLASIGWSIYAVLVLTFAALAIAFFRFRDGRLKIALVAAPVFLGFLYYYFYLGLTGAENNVLLNERISFTAIVVSEPQIGEQYQRFTVKLETPYSGKVDLITPFAPRFNYGDRLEIEGLVEPARSVAEHPTVTFPRVTLLELHRASLIKERLISFKQALILEHKKFLSPDEAALMAGLTFGHRAEFTKEFKAQMAKSGTTHIVALSGYNIAILVFAVAYAFKYFFSKRLTFYFTTAIIFLFVMMVGAEASVTRAALMGFLLLLSGEVGRQYSFKNAVTLVAAAMVLIDPKILRFDVGFQLSFLSLLGIVYLAPALKRFLRFPEKDTGFLKWRENFSTTFAAQLAVVPLLLTYFGEFSLSSLLANVLILTFVPFTMFVGFLLSALGLIFTPLGFAAAWLAKFLLGYEIGIIKLFAAFRLPVAAGSLSWFYALLFYTVLVGIIFHYQKVEQKAANEKR